MTEAAASRRLTCPSCRGSAWTEVDEDNRSYRLFRCANCGCYRIVAQHDVTPEELYDRYYSEDSAQRLVGVFDVVWRSKRRARARLIAQHAPPGARICDVGCERGELLNVLKVAGCRVVGTQLSNAAARYALKHFGVEVFVGELMNAPFADEQFDAIIMLNILEHLPDPERYVAQASRMLKEGGVFWVEVPNAGSFTARACGKNWLHHDPEHHLWAFDSAGICRLIERHGFASENVYHHSWEHGPIGALQSWLNFLPGPKNMIFDIVRHGLKFAPSAMAFEFLHIALGCLLLPLACVVAGVESTIGNGQVILIRARRTADRADA